jgi:hypothetical protein
MGKKKFTCVDCIKKFDFYKMMPSSLAEPSVAGASMTLMVFLAMAVLFCLKSFDFL